MERRLIIAAPPAHRRRQAPQPLAVACAWIGSPESNRVWMAMISEPTVLRDERPAILDCRGVDEPVGRVARKRGRQPDSGGGDRRTDRDRSRLCGELLQPGGDGD